MCSVHTIKVWLPKYSLLPLIDLWKWDSFVCEDKFKEGQLKCDLCVYIVFIDGYGDIEMRRLSNAALPVTIAYVIVACSQIYKLEKSFILVVLQVFQ